MELSGQFLAEVDLTHSKVTLSVMTSCTFVRGYKRFGETYRLYLQSGFLRNVGSRLQYYSTA
jgi:hypothetical protein